MRERLVMHQPGDERLVLLSPFDETRLAKDVITHLGDWLEPRLQQHALLVRTLWNERHAGDMLAIGLVCSLIYRKGQKQYLPAIARGDQLGDGVFPVETALGACPRIGAVARESRFESLKTQFEL
ncbi:MAG: hypothetical protein GY924_20835 [Planctomycetaceae bacterium]|nr:hypothetical protein [Planctomycetaceae bacterium]